MFGFEGIGYNDKNLFLHFSEIRKDEHIKKLLESCNIHEIQLTFHQRCYNNYTHSKYTHSKALAKLTNTEECHLSPSDHNSEEPLEVRKSSRTRDPLGKKCIF